MSADRIRHPLGITPPGGVPVRGDFAAVQAAEIVRLDGALASARGRIVDLEHEEHGLRNRLTAAAGALELLAMELDLPADATPRQVCEAALRRLK